MQLVCSNFNAFAVFYGNSPQKTVACPHSYDLFTIARSTINIESSVGLAYEFIYRPYSAPVEAHTAAEKVIKMREKAEGRCGIFDQPIYNVDQLKRQFPAFVEHIGSLPPHFFHHDDV